MWKLYAIAGKKVVSERRMECTVMCPFSLDFLQIVCLAFNGTVDTFLYEIYMK